MNPLEFTRTAPLRMTIRDCLVGAWVGAGDEPALQPPSAGRPPTWTIDVGGHEYPGPPLDASRHADSDAVREMLRLWAKEHHEFFD